jgi:medium-chain acyl-[acyl-carrier-protein] hydrolase
VHPRVRLFCFPYAGGGASALRLFAEYLSTDIEMWPVQLPGRENRFGEKAFSRLDELVSALVQALLPYLDSPYAFWGHSMGALISFELTCALRRKGLTPGPIRLAVSGHRAPHLPDPRPPIHGTSNEEFLDGLRRLNGTPEEVLQHKDLLPVLLPMLRADFELCETYEYRAEMPLDCPISAFGGLKDPDVTRESILAWGEQTRSTFQARFFRGDHFFLHDEREALMSILSQELLGDLGAL